MKKKLLILIASTTIVLAGCGDKTTPTPNDNTGNNNTGNDPLTEFLEVDGVRIEGSDFSDRSTDTTILAGIPNSYTTDFDFGLDKGIPASYCKLEFLEPTVQDYVPDASGFYDNDVYIEVRGFSSGTGFFRSTDGGAYDECKYYLNNDTGVFEFKNVTLTDKDNSDWQVNASGRIFFLPN